MSKKAKIIIAVVLGAATITTVAVVGYKQGWFTKKS